MKTFGKNLKTLRVEANISQINFAKLLNTTQQRVSEWECDKTEPNLYYVVKILKVLGTDFETLTEGFR